MHVMAIVSEFSDDFRSCAIVILHTAIFLQLAKSVCILYSGSVKVPTSLAQEFISQVVSRQMLAL